MPSQVGEIQRLYNLLTTADNINFITLPDLANSIQLTAKNVAWNYGNWAEIVATVGAVDFWLTRVDWENLSAPAAGYQVQLGTGLGGAEVGRAAVRVMGPGRELLIAMRIAAGIRLAGRAASSTGVADTIDVVAGGYVGA